MVHVNSVAMFKDDFFWKGEEIVREDIICS